MKLLKYQSVSELVLDELQVGLVLFVVVLHLLLEVVEFAVHFFVVCVVALACFLLSMVLRLSSGDLREALDWGLWLCWCWLSECGGVPCGLLIGLSGVCKIVLL